MIGYGAVVLALIVTLIAASCLGAVSIVRKSGRQSWEHSGRFCYQVSVGLIGIAAIYLLYLILGNRFEYAYVFAYTSRDLPLAYKLSAFWAGQEGSFLLWLVFHALFGLLLTRKPAAPGGVITVYSLLQAVLLVMLLVKSPFMMLAEPRLEGAGLNPLLQDPWMVIHPPVLFLGYAALAVPFAYAMDGMLTGRHQEWPRPATPWALFALATLGGGMFIGGFWAYKVLGWGGYWAWDPVENSSLVPWLVAGALVHLLFLAMIRPGAVKVAYVAVICGFSLVLYGTFLTRSGVLSDFSTHSFADEGIGGILGLTVLVVACLAFVLYIAKLPGMPAGQLYPGIASREFTLALTALLLAFFGSIVFVGMSTPLVTMAFGSPQSVSSAFYNQATLPLAIAMAAALTAGPYLRWGESQAGSSKKFIWPVLGLLGGLLLAGKLMLLQPLIMLTIGLACAGTAANVYGAYTRRMSLAASFTHIGVTVMLVGIMASGAGSQSKVITFVQGQQQSIYGQPFSYIGIEDKTDGEGFYHTFHAGLDQTAVKSLTKLNRQGAPAAREPGIYRTLLADIYIAPIPQEDNDHGPELTLVKGQPVMQDGVSLTFIKFNMVGLDGSGEVRVQTIIEVSADGQTQEVRPELTSRNGHIVGSTVTAFDRYALHITGIKPGEGQATVEFKDLKATQQAAMPKKLEAEISHKPLINLVWLGAILITAGAGWAAWNRLIGYTQQVKRGQGPAVRT